MSFDRRITPARSDLAAAHLRGTVEAGRFVEGTSMRVIAPLLQMAPQPQRDVSIDTQALFGEEIVVYESDQEGWSWGQLTRDGYVGFVPSEGIGHVAESPTHRVNVPQTILYPAANMKARLLGAVFRVAYPMSAAMPGVLPRAGFSLDGGRLRLHLPADLAFLAGEHLESRLDQLAGVAGVKSSEIVAG